MMLRAYQSAACDIVERRWTDGRRGVVLVLPTGGGKTATASELVRRDVARGGRVLWLAPRIELVSQAARALREAGLDVGIIAATDPAGARPDARVQVASVQTALSRGLEGGWTLIVFDEAHLSAGEQWSTLLTRSPDARRLGLTATPARQDGVGLGALYDVIVVGATIRQLTELGHLVPLDVISPTKVLRTGQLAQSPVASWAAHGDGHSSVLFAPNLAAARKFASEFTTEGISARVVDGEMPPQERIAALAEYEAGRVTVLCSVGVLTTGWDSPKTSVGILARRCGSPSLVIQMAGRLLRPHPGKTRATFLDLTGTCRIEGIGRPDADREYSLDGLGIRGVGEVVAGAFCQVCGAALDGRECGECGFAIPIVEQRVIGATLRKLAADFLVEDSQDKRTQRLVKWALHGFEHGHKPNAAFVKFRALYKHWPTAAQQGAVRAAIDAARARSEGRS